jgi:hypothetical protein
MKVAELKDVLRGLDLPTTGKKADLLARVLAAADPVVSDSAVDGGGGGGGSIDVRVQHVYAHVGTPGNECADELADGAGDAVGDGGALPHNGDGAALPISYVALTPRQFKGASTCKASSAPAVAAALMLRRLNITKLVGTNNGGGDCGYEPIAPTSFGCADDDFISSASATAAGSSDEFASSLQIASQVHSLLTTLLHTMPSPNVDSSGSSMSKDDRDAVALQTATEEAINAAKKLESMVNDLGRRS